MINANTDNIRPRLADVIYDIAVEYSAEILTDNRFWHILSHKFSFASDPALRNAMHYCIDEELIAHVYHYRDNIEVVTKHIDDSVKKAASDGYSENIVRDILLATADGIKIDLNPAAIIVNVTLVSPEAKTPETKTPEAKTPEATSTPSHIIPPVDYMIPTGSIPLPPDPVWEKQKKKMKRNFDLIAVLSFAIATVLVICFSLAARKTNDNSEAALHAMPTDTIQEKAPELPDLSGMSLEERNQYLVDSHKNTRKSFGIFGPRLGDGYTLAELHTEENPNTRLRQNSLFGRRYIISTAEWGGHHMYAKAFLDNYEVYAIHVGITSYDDLFDDYLAQLMKDYGRPEIYLKKREKKKDSVDYDSPTFKDDVKEYRWTYKNGMAIMTRDYILLVKPGKLDQALHDMKPVWAR